MEVGTLLERVEELETTPVPLEVPIEGDKIVGSPVTNTTAEFAR
jgi:hypothetical protein